MGLTRFNTQPADELTQVLLACCDVPQWAATVREGRPYASTAAVVETADAASRAFTPADVDRALRAHPRIGEQADAEATTAAWSRQEQSDVQRDTATLTALRDANRAYEERFGQVFLICAAGLTSEQILSALHTRLDNDPTTEAQVVADELRMIALHRLRGVLES